MSCLLLCIQVGKADHNSQGVGEIEAHVDDEEGLGSEDLVRQVAEYLGNTAGSTLDVFAWDSDCLEEDYQNEDDVED